jgi:hypothetical protein
MVFISIVVHSLEIVAAVYLVDEAHETSTA